MFYFVKITVTIIFCFFDRYTSHTSAFSGFPIHSLRFQLHLTFAHDRFILCHYSFILDQFSTRFGISTDLFELSMPLIKHFLREVPEPKLKGDSGYH